MSELPSKHLEKLIFTLIFLFPVSMGTVASAASGILIVLLLFGLALSWSEWGRINSEEKFLCIGMVVFFCLAFLSVVNADDSAKFWSKLERLLRILAFIPIFLFLRKLSFDPLRALSLGMIAAGPVLLLAAVLTQESGRSTGAYNAILFGDYAAYTSVFLITFIALEQANLRLKAIALVALMCALQATIMSETRGAWLVILVAFPILLIVYLRSIGKQSYRWQTLLIFTVALGALVLVSLQDTRLQSRGSLTVTELKSYIDNSNLNTSVGYRFQMWRAAVVIWEKNPMIGSGLGDYSTDLQSLMEPDEGNSWAHFGEAHNLFLEFLATTGLLGLSACLFSLFIWPLKLFLNKPKDPHCYGNLFRKTSGILLVISFVLMGLSQNWLGRSSISSVYILFLALILARSKPVQK